MLRSPPQSIGVCKHRKRIRHRKEIKLLVLVKTENSREKKKREENIGFPFQSHHPPFDWNPTTFFPSPFPPLLLFVTSSASSYTMILPPLLLLFESAEMLKPSITSSNLHRYRSNPHHYNSTYHLLYHQQSPSITSSNCHSLKSPFPDPP